MNQIEQLEKDDHPRIKKINDSSEWIMEIYFQFRDTRTSIVAEKQPPLGSDRPSESQRWVITISNDGLERIFKCRRSLDMIGQKETRFEMLEILEEALEYEQLSVLCPECGETHMLRPDLGVIADYSERDKEPIQALREYRDSETFICGSCVVEARRRLNRFDNQSGQVKIFGDWR